VPQLSRHPLGCHQNIQISKGNIMRVITASILIILVIAVMGCSTFRTPEPRVPIISGKWSIQQLNAGGLEYTGTLYLYQNGSTISGMADWDNHQKGSIVNGVIHKSSIDQEYIVCFFIIYRDMTPGKYYATLNSSGKVLFDGTTIRERSFGMWNAELIDEK
jgi:hypothetical protein